jgi:hypothetical protein
MNQKGIVAMERLTEHVERQRVTRETEGYKKSIRPSKAAVAEREAIMDEIVEAAGLSASAIQVRLGVNRTTWERWRKMGSIPNRTHLDHLRRLIEDQGSASLPHPSMPTLPSPLTFLSWTPRTYGQLRVLFSHADYHWKDAVFHFKSPFEDKMTGVDMASLALNGCRLVYILKSSYLSNNSGTTWLNSFVEDMVSSLGRKVSSRALANFCLVEITDSDDESLREFGVLNFWSLNEEDRVGYFWKGNQTAKAEDYTSDPDKYTPTEASDVHFDPLKQQYYAALQKAFDTIDSNTSREVEKQFDNEKGKFPFDIPRIIAASTENKILTVYINPPPKS